MPADQDPKTPHCIDCSGKNVGPCGPDKPTNGVRPHWTCPDCGSCFGDRPVPAPADEAKRAEELTNG